MKGAHVFIASSTAAGVLRLRHADQFRSCLVSFAGQDGFEIEVRKITRKRSVKQSRWWWGVFIKEVAEHLGYDRHEHEGLHYELVKLWGGTHVDETSGLTLPNKRSSELTTEEFSDLMEWGVRFAAEKWNLYILLPSDVLTSKDKRPLINRPKARQAAHT